LAQSTLAPHARLLGVAPDIVLLFTVSWALLQGAREGVLVALIGGLVLDSLSAEAFGGQTLALLVVGTLAGIAGANIFRTERLLPYMAIVVATMLYYLVLLVLLAATGRPVAWGPMALRVVLPAIAYNGISMVIVHSVSRWARGFLYPSPVEWE
jgi:rod shape-determining protein MreD